METTTSNPAASSSTSSSLLFSKNNESNPSAGGKSTSTNRPSNKSHFAEKRRHHREQRELREHREPTKSPEIDVNSLRESPCASPMDKLERQVGIGEQSSATKIDSDTNPAPLDNSADTILTSLSSWEWVTIDGLQLPAVARNNERFVAVHMVQLKLLSKFPSYVPPDIIENYTLSSHKMTLAEAWTLNSINAVIRKFDLGCRLYTASDELVKLNDVQMFYWNVKLVNLLRMEKEYEQAVQPFENQTHLRATILTLKSQVENDIQAVRAELSRRAKNLNTSKAQEETTSNINHAKKLLNSKNT